MLTTLVLLVLLVLAGFGAARAPGGAADEPPATATVTVASTYHGLSAAKWHHKFARMRHLAYRRKLQGRRDVRATIQNGYGNSWLERAFLCIHSHEGSWDDPNPPYWGGVQMDMTFMQRYAAWALKAFGTADHWPVSVQISTAIEAKVSGRGFFPWPNTARACGLL